MYSSLFAKDPDIQRHHRQQLPSDAIRVAITLSLDILTFMNPTLLTLNLAIKSLLIIHDLATLAFNKSDNYENAQLRVKSLFSAGRGIVTASALYYCLSHVATLASPALAYFSVRAFTAVASLLAEDQAYRYMSQDNHTFG